MKPPDSILAACVHQNSGTHDICLQKDAGIFNRTIHMALGSKIDNDVGMLFLKKLIHRLPIADVRSDKAEIGVVNYAFERGKIPRISQFVQTHNTVFGILAQHVKDEITADKSRPACYNDCH